MEIYFIGIGGIGVSALAQYYLANGWKVKGSDLNQSEIISLLKKKGADIWVRTNKKTERKKINERINKKIDLVVYSPAVRKSDPELVRAEKLGIKTKSYPQALGDLSKDYFTIAVCGTHGKSTTSAMISLVLTKTGLNPTVILGTRLEEFQGSNFRFGGLPKKGKFKEKILVIEADEHFSSFLNYSPNIIALTNIEADHLDYYRNPKNYFNAFKKFAGRLPENGVLIFNKNDKKSNQLGEELKKTNVKTISYSLRQKEAKEIKKKIKVPGRHNISNALAAFETAKYLGISKKEFLSALAEYKGCWRRFELAKIKTSFKKKTKEIILISDYAHHPSEIKSTAKAARERFSKEKIWFVFQPHQRQRTFYFFNDFVKAFKELFYQKIKGKDILDKVIITDIYDVPGREEGKLEISRINSGKLVEKIKEEINEDKILKEKKEQSIVYIPSKNNFNEIRRYLKENGEKVDVVIIAGAGDIYNLFKELKT